MTKGEDLRGRVIPLTLDRPRTLKFNLNAICLIEEKHGDVDAFMRSIQTPGAGGFAKTRFLIWAGLVHEDPDLTELDVGGMIDIGNIDDVQAAIVAALNAGMPDAKKKQTVSQVKDSQEKDNPAKKTQ